MTGEVSIGRHGTGCQIRCGACQIRCNHTGRSAQRRSHQTWRRIENEEPRSSLVTYCSQYPGGISDLFAAARSGCLAANQCRCRQPDVFCSYGSGFSCHQLTSALSSSHARESQLTISDCKNGISTQCMKKHEKTPDATIPAVCSSVTASFADRMA